MKPNSQPESATSAITVPVCRPTATSVASPVLLSAGRPTAPRIGDLGPRPLEAPRYWRYHAITRPSVSRASSRSGSSRVIASETCSYGSLPSKMAQFSMSSPSRDR